MLGIPTELPPANDTTGTNRAAKDTAQFRRDPSEGRFDAPHAVTLIAERLGDFGCSRRGPGPGALTATRILTTAVGRRTDTDTVDYSAISAQRRELGGTSRPGNAKRKLVERVQIVTSDAKLTLFLSPRHFALFRDGEARPLDD